MPRTPDEHGLGDAVAAPGARRRGVPPRKGDHHADDLEALAPKVPHAGQRRRASDADPTLDDDLAAWWSDDCPLPRLTLLGPVARPDPRHRADQAQAVLHRDARLPGHPSPRRDPGRARRRLQHHPGQGPRLRPHRARLARQRTRAPATSTCPTPARRQPRSPAASASTRSRPARRRGPVPPAPRPGRVARTRRRRGPRAALRLVQGRPFISSATTDGPGCRGRPDSTST